MGQQSLFADLGIPLGVTVWTDSSAAMGICTRQGLGKLRHIDTQALWIQEKVRTKQITLRKVKGDVNPADLLTKFMTGRDKIDQLIKLYGLVAMKGRAKSAPLLRKKKTAELPEEDLNEMEVNIVKDLDEMGDVLVPEAGSHDIEVWPHMHDEEMRARLFPIAVAVPELESISEEDRQEHARLHRRWAATRITVTRG